MPVVGFSPNGGSPRQKTNFAIGEIQGGTVSLATASGANTDGSVGLDEFKQGLALLRDGSPQKALPHLRRALKVEQNNPYYLSFLGLATALAEKKWADAELLCEMALRMKRNEARLYLNLAEVYTKAGRRGDAMETLALGLQYAGRTPVLVRALERIRVRRPHVLPFLCRGHFLNRRLGMLRHRVSEFFSEQ